jgi:hypothetical protein
LADYSGFTWSAFLSILDGQIKNALGNRDPMTLRYSLPGGGMWEGRSVKELMELRGYVAQQASDEAASTGTASRLVQATPLRRYDG